GCLGSAADFAEVDVGDGLARDRINHLSSTRRSGFGPVGRSGRMNAIGARQQIAEGILTLAIADQLRLTRFVESISIGIKEDAPRRRDRFAAVPNTISICVVEVGTGDGGVGLRFAEGWRDKYLTRGNCYRLTLAGGRTRLCPSRGRQ